MNVVSVMAHQDDEMFCLGTMLKCKARGDRLFFITLTDGSMGCMQNPGVTREEGAAIRQREMEALVSSIGAPYINIAEQDEMLYDTPEVRKKLIEALRSVEAELVFTHFDVDYNLDHTRVHALARHCTMLAGLPLLPTASPPLKAPPAVFMIEPHGVIPFPASYYVDTSDTHQAKVRLLQNHASQEESMRRAVGEGVGAICSRVASFRGGQVGCAFAECFIPMPARGALKPYPVLP